MRNLKKVLSLTLALVMMLGMMTFAGAAEVTKVTSKDMTDMDKVVNKEAVSLLVDLGIINGIKAADGTYTFNPVGNIERGAYAKMVYAVMMGSDNADVYKGVNTGLKDVKGHWAEGFIGYCVSTKIAAGNGNGTFTPNANITVVAGAKMLLVGLGYDAKLSGYENDPLWSINIMRDAQAAGLLEGIGQASGDTMTRDTAAQMIFNALFANTVRPDFQMDMGVKYLNGYLAVLDKAGNAITLATRNFNLKTFTGVVVANDFGAVAGATQDAGKTLIWTTFASGKLNSTGAKTMKVATGVDMLGQQVTYYTHGNKDVDSSFVVATGKTKTYTYNDSDITHAKFLTNNGITIVGTNACVTNYAPADDYTPTAAEAATLVDSNADGKIDFTMKSTYIFSKVTKVDATNITITGLGTRKLADVSGAAGLVKGDYVSYTSVGSNGKAAVVKAIEVAGTVTALKDTKGKAVINGTTYAVAANAEKAVIAAPAKDAFNYIKDLELSKAVAGIFYLNQAGKIAVYLPTEATTDTTALYAYVTAFQKTTNFNKNTIEVKAVLADGTKSTFKVVDNTNADTNGLYDMAVAANDEDKVAAIKGVYPYTLNKDGEMVGGVKVANNVYTNDAYVAGKPTMNLDTNATDTVTSPTSILLNADTTVLFYVAGDPDKITSIKGVDKVPGIAKNQAVTYVTPAAGKSFTPFILVGAVGTVATAEYAYALGNDYTAQTADGYQYDMVVNGAKVTLTTADVVADMRIGMIYTYGLDADKIATLAAVNSTVITEGTVKSVSANYVVIGTTAVELASTYSVDDLTSVDSKGNIVPGTGALSADAKIVYVTSADKLVKAYVINTGKAAFKDDDTANNGTTLSVDGYNLTIAGQYTAAENKMSLTFTAPAGVSASSDAAAITIKISATNGSFNDNTTVAKAAVGKTSVDVPFTFPGAATAGYIQIVIKWNADITETYIIDATGLTVHA